MHSAVVDDKGCGDSIFCLCLGLAMTLYGRHCQVKGSYSLKEDRHTPLFGFLLCLNISLQFVANWIKGKCQ